MGGFEVISTREGLARLHLLGGALTRGDDRAVQIPEGGKRLVAYMALHGRRVERRRAAGVIWPHVDTAPRRREPALGDVAPADSARHRRHRGRQRASLWLHPSVDVDLEAVSRWAGDRMVDRATEIQ